VIGRAGRMADFTRHCLSCGGHETAKARQGGNPGVEPEPLSFGSLISAYFSSSLPHIIRAAMPTRYVGLFCPNGHFNVQDTYAVEHVNAPLLLHWIVNRQTKLRCKKCARTFSSQQSDVAHSNWRDGREPHYPHKH
jgi:hypothetical protein